jgi:tetratricopeptide (TPR) repeat protein
LGHGRRAAALHHLARLRQLHPRRATTWLESALALDRLVREAEAIPFYERALRLGLKGAARRDALVCLASSLREVGRPREAVRHLERARRLFPGDVVVPLFLALGYHDVGQHAKALRLLASICLAESRDSNVLAYRSALTRKYRALTVNNGQRPARSTARAKK